MIGDMIAKINGIYGDKSDIYKKIRAVCNCSHHNPAYFILLPAIRLPFRA